ncbi:MAG: DEAD/DEAH box helicase, partial [Clostridia bacterium]|nr:DEAD/DEAH box helicase [Clostridia bacterium]
MHVFSKMLGASPVFAALADAVRSARLPADVTGAGYVHKVLLTRGLCDTCGRRALVLCADEAEAVRMSEDLTALGMRALFYPARELTLYDVTGGSREFEQQRLGVLAQVLRGDYDCVVACADAAVQFTLPPEALRAHTVTLTAGAPLPVADLADALTRAGYERFPQIEGPGQFAVRGGIIDLYPAACPAPIRLELWGDTVDTLSYFDLLSQRRTDPIDSIEIPPVSERIVDDTDALASAIADLADGLRGKAAQAREYLLGEADRIAGGGSLSSDKYLPLLYPRLCTLLDYAPDALVLLSEPTGVRERVRTAGWQVEQDITALLEEGKTCRALSQYLPPWEDVTAALQARGCVLLDSFARAQRDFAVRHLFDLTARQLPVWSGDLSLLTEDLTDLRARGLACAVLAGSEERTARRLAEELTAHDIPALFAPSPSELSRSHVTVLCGGLSAGAEFPDAGWAVITHGRAAVRKKRKPRVGHRGADIHSLSELQPGDYVVHILHGIGQYQGVHQLTVQGVVKDYLKLQYAKGDVLYVPVTQLDLVSKYIGAKEDAPVRLHKLGGQEWQNTKARVRSAVKDIAKELIALYAKRMESEGFAFDPDEEWQYDFERRFEFEETEDQLRCADEIKHDMERPVPMDRLLCGDVGFGKTEVALRAAFKCVSQGKQCAILVPTTILAYQHYQTVLRRFEGFPVRIEMLSRFRTARQQEETLKKLARGEVEIVVGTHRLLSKDIKFRDLGLFIVDEEQRFGVAQKERLKELAPQVDVLTLSA